MTLTCECSPCSCSVGLRIVYIVFAFIFSIIWWIFSIITATTTVPTLNAVQPPVTPSVSTPSYTAPAPAPAPAPTPTPTGSYIPAPTPTRSYIPTPINSYTPSGDYTPTPTNSYTPSGDYTPTPTPTNSYTPSGYYTPTITPTPTPSTGFIYGDFYEPSSSYTPPSYSPTYSPTWSLEDIYTISFQGWYIFLTTMLFVGIYIVLVTLIIFWFCWNDGKRCYTIQREMIVLIIFTVLVAGCVVLLAPVVLLRETPDLHSDDVYLRSSNDIFYFFLAWTGIWTVFSGVGLVVILILRCRKQEIGDVVMTVPTIGNTSDVPSETGEIILPWLIKKGDIGNSWECLDKYYRKSISINSKKYASILRLFFSQLDGKNINIKEIFAIHNPTLYDQFNNRRKVMKDRQKEDPDTWLTPTWSEEDPQKVWVYDNYKKLVASFVWNNEDTELPIIPVLHGTDVDIAWKICRSGFAALARLDAGWYGAGNYFSTSALYCFPYFGAKPNPTLILSYVIPGNVFPVTEAKDGTNSLLGKPLTKRCGSHFALVTKDGNVCKLPMESGHFVELVIEQEAQILPSFLFMVDKGNFSELATIYNRDIPEK